MDTTWRIAISTFAATVFTPIILRALGRALPGCQTDATEHNSLYYRYRSIELWSQLAACIGIIGAVLFFILARMAILRGLLDWFLVGLFSWPSSSSLHSLFRMASPVGESFGDFMNVVST